MPPLKICHMTSVHSAADPRIFHKQCRSLAKAGFDVTLIGPHSNDAVLDGVRIKAIRRDTDRLTRMTRTAWRVYNAARLHDADVYHFHDPELIPFGLLLRANGKRVIYDIHEDLPKDVLSKDYLPRCSRAPISAVMNFIENLACGSFSAVVAGTHSIADRFENRNCRTVVVHNFPYAEELITEGENLSWAARRQSVAYV